MIFWVFMILVIVIFVIAHWYWFLVGFIILCFIIALGYFWSKKDEEDEKEEYDEENYYYEKRNQIKYKYEPLLVISFKDLLLKLETKSLRTILSEKSKENNLEISETEKQSWNNNEKFFTETLRKAKIHDESIIAFEWLQKDKRRIDVVIFGKDKFYNNNLIIFELKAWSSDNNNIANLISLQDHPVKQSLSYYHSIKNILADKEIEDEIKLNSFVYMYNYNRNNLSYNDKLLFEKKSDFERNLINNFLFTRDDNRKLIILLNNKFGGGKGIEIYKMVFPHQDDI